MNSRFDNDGYNLTSMTHGEFISLHDLVWDTVNIYEAAGNELSEDEVTVLVHLKSLLERWKQENHG